MPTNPYFNHFQNTPEQNLHQDLIIESIKNFGLDVYYLPRKLINLDNLYLEDTISEFTDSYLIEMYVKSVDGFEGDGDFISRFGLEIRDQVTFSVARRRWENLDLTDYTRPKEGDLIFFPLNKKIYEIKFVEHESLFYQFGKLPIFDLTCELFQYDDQTISTGIDDIDDIEEKYSYTTEYKYLIGDTAAITPQILNSRISSVSIENYGSGYFTIPNITVSDPDIAPTTALVTSNISNGQLTSFNIIDFGTYYIQNPSVTIESPGSPVTATATTSLLANSVDSITITNKGSFYTSNPTLTIEGPTSVPITGIAEAALTANSLTGAKYISSINLINSGSYYLNPPTVTIQDTIAIPNNWTEDSKFGDYAYQLGKTDTDDAILKNFRSDYNSSINYGGNFSFWFKYDSNLHQDSGINDVTIFEFKNGSFLQGYVSIFNNTGVIRFSVYDTVNQLYHFPSCPSTNILDGDWHFLQFIKSRNVFTSTVLKIIVDSDEVVNYNAPFAGVWQEELFTNYNTSNGNGGVVLKNSSSKGFLIDDIFYDGDELDAITVPTSTRNYITDNDDLYDINFEGFNKKLASATATINDGIIDSITIDDQGDMYDTVPSITIDDPTGTSSNFTPVISPVINDGVLESIVIVYGGNFYEENPVITISDPTGTYSDFTNINATATATYDENMGTLNQITITNPGKFYYQNPSVLISNPTGISQNYKAQLSASLYANGSLRMINIDNRGYGYSQVPVVTIDSPLSTVNKGDTVIGNDSGVRGEISYKDSTTVKIINSGGSFAQNEFIKTDSGHAIKVYDQTDDQSFINDETAQNVTIENEADSIIDFSETNPFSESNF